MANLAPLVILSGRDPVRATGDILSWVQRYRPDNDPSIYEEQRRLLDIWNAEKSNGPGMLFEIDANMTVNVSVIHNIQPVL